MRIVADRERCEGHGICINQAPSLLGLDDDDIVLAPEHDLSPDEEGQARVAVASCPVAALVLAEDGCP
ncbi:ferredoxin [Nocardioides silvaticus]|uniref:Ferredoxin n=1 Tax=Nocardioides silvaticus TaxID=2201891 RepID=A0A316TFH9_9ACTN|nr:ferredoxin [Nocardioides silvaticus]PWN03273.1 ferredoxin [Nocardioides silvaticus]